jgi:hypothetical protein
MPKHDTSAGAAAEARLLAGWARRYAKSRTISFLVQWVFIVLLVTAIGFSAQYAHDAQRAHALGKLYAAVTVMILAFFGLAWFSVSSRGGAIIWRITQWLYGAEGYVSDDEDARPAPWWVSALTAGLVLYHLAGALLVTFGHLPMRTLQPFSALYMSPYIALMIFHQRLGAWAWCWPVLYAVHAALLQFTELPLRFAGKFELLNLAVPVFGYGLVSILVGHAYNRFALYQLRRIARRSLDSAGGGVEDDAS